MIKLGKKFVVNRCPKVNLTLFDQHIMATFALFHDFEGGLTGGRFRCILDADARASCPAQVWQGWQALKIEAAAMVAEEAGEE